MLVLNGPNLGRLGSREPGVRRRHVRRARGRRLCTAPRSGSRSRFARPTTRRAGPLAPRGGRLATPVVLNPAAFTHYSYAVRDAFAQRTARHLSTARSRGVPAHVGRVRGRERHDRRLRRRLPTCSRRALSPRSSPYYCGDRLRAATGDVDASLVTSLTSTRYLTGFTGSHGAVLLPPRRRRRLSGTDFRYVTQVESERPGIEVVVDRNAAAALTAYAVSLGVTRLGIEAEHERLRARRPRRPTRPSSSRRSWAPWSGAQLRQGDHEERRRSPRPAASSPRSPEIRVGRTEREIARRLEALMLDHGAEAISFPSIVAAGPNSAIPHHVPPTRPSRPPTRQDRLRCAARRLPRRPGTFVVGRARPPGRPSCTPSSRRPSGPARGPRGGGDVRRGRRRCPGRHQ